MSEHVIPIRPVVESTIVAPERASGTPLVIEPLSALPVASGRVDRRFTGLLCHPLLLMVISLLPFWVIPLAHLASDPDTATGFYHEELPYYMANGRAAFDRGNGLTYPNPYDPDAAAPDIYFHWLMWLLGLLPAYFGSDPGDVIICLTFLASGGFAAVTWRLVEIRRLPGTAVHGPFLLAMWGGGLLVVAGLAAGSLKAADPLSSLLQFDPGRGLWFLNWGRNALFATEAIYHILAAGCWINEMRGQRTRGTFCCLLLATTHPWSGLELLLTLNLWRLVQLIRQRDRQSLTYAACAVTMLTAFLGYYKLWLPQFPRHSQLQQVWELDWSLSWRSAGLAYGLVLIPALARLRQALPLSRVPSSGDLSVSGSVRESRVWQPLEPCEQFLLCALLVAAGLVFHDRLIRPVQPLHFTRGYLWMPLFLLGLPVFQAWWKQACDGPLRQRLVLAGYCGLLVIDNLAFSAIHTRWQWTQTNGFRVDAADYAMLMQLQRRFAGQVILSESETLNYLAPAYTSVRPWLGHPFNTPEFPVRKAVVARVFSDEITVDAIPMDVDVLVIRRSRSSRPLQRAGGWVYIESHNAAWEFWSRLRGSAAAAGLLPAPE